GHGQDSVEQLIKRIRTSAALDRWQKVKVLIIDEISMIDGDLFDKLEEIARNVRSDNRSFGGIQVVITGDFSQLPPVPYNYTTTKFAFESKVWKVVMKQTIVLRKVWRQADQGKEFPVAFLL